MRLLIDGARLRDTLRPLFRGQMAHDEKGSPGSLRIAALIALLSGGGGSVVLVLRAGQRTPAFLLVIMVVCGCSRRLQPCRVATGAVILASAAADSWERKAR